MRIVAAFVVMLCCVASFSHAQLNEQQMMAKLKEYNEKALGLCNKANKAEWNVATDIGNQEKEEELVCIRVIYSEIFSLYSLSGAYVLMHNSCSKFIR